MIFHLLGIFTPVLFSFSKLINFILLYLLKRQDRVKLMYPCICWNLFAIIMFIIGADNSFHDIDYIEEERCREQLSRVGALCIIMIFVLLIHCILFWVARYRVSHLIGLFLSKDTLTLPMPRKSPYWLILKQRCSQSANAA